MSQTYKIADQETAHYMTFQVIDWVDTFSRKIYRDILVDSMIFCPGRLRCTDC